MIQIIEHTKQLLNQYFDFLSPYGFGDMQEMQLAYEYHYIYTSAQRITLDIQVELIASSAIWITINNISIEKLFPNARIFKDYKNRLDTLYGTNFQTYLKTNNDQYLHTNYEIFLREVTILNEWYLCQIKNLLLANDAVLKDENITKTFYKNEQWQHQKEETERLETFSEMINLKSLSQSNIIENLETNIMFIETDKVSVEIETYEQLEALFQWEHFSNENQKIWYKFEPK